VLDKSKKVLGWEPDFLEESDEDVQSEEGLVDDDDASQKSKTDDNCFTEEVPDTLFDEPVDHTEKPSEDPFNIYPLLNKEKAAGMDNGKECESLKYPPGFTPSGAANEPGFSSSAANDHDINKECGSKSKENNEGLQQHCEGNNSSARPNDQLSDSNCSGRFKTSEIPRSRGSILSLMDELVRVGQTMGYRMEGCENDIIEIIESQRASMVNVLALQETKMKHMELFCVKSCWGNYAFEFVHSDSVGNSGGILCAWDPNSFRKSSSTVLDFFVIVRGVWLKSGRNMMLVVVRNKSERFGSVFHAQAAKIFNSFVMNAGLDESSYDYGPSPFRFYHHWLEVDGFSNLVNDSWNEAPVDNSNGIRNLMKKLQYLKNKIREWNYANKSSSSAAMTNLKKELHILEEAIDNGKSSETIISKRLEAIDSIQRLNKISIDELAQKAKIKWSVEGDENSKFFHGMLNKKRSQMNIRGVMSDGVWIDKPDLVKSEFLHHFSNRFVEPSNRNIHLDMSFPFSFSVEQQEELESMVTREELKRAVWDCGVNKSPGPDGFTFGFYRHFWSLIENDVFVAIKHFFTYGVIPKGCNSSFIALIPKVPDANLVKDFRRISLIGSIYKIIAKILANRLVNVLDGIVNEVQSAFVVGRQMLDGPFIINEIIQWCRSKKRKAVIFKVDFEKAFDSVRWDYLDEILSNHRKASWAKWSTVITPKEKGGLGVASLYAFNRGLMLKWLWRFFSYLNSLWVRVVKAIHGEDGCMGKYLKTGARSCWLNIVKEASILKDHGVNFFEFLKPKLGDGAKFSFWDDNWCEGGILKSRFPRIYALDTCKKVTVKFNLVTSNMDSSLRRLVREGEEQSQYDALTGLIGGVNLLPQMDRYAWTLDGTCEFTVSSIRKTIDDIRSPSVSSRNRWVKFMPIRLNVFAWKVKLNALPTRINISRRGIDINSLSCPLCQHGVESSSH
nr:RNA-directed DNA polymerase, eukaryota, reverse transcriptase zinc-binding domain protein [Tanacetum cinerariifolium]GEY81503.1 RNA-directed DNA polymerase, eukaryota, reverse transcriptase zinc-binding domain protein [Tanacetum cinerariifolium]